jgi:hypothetical protein
MAHQAFFAGLVYDERERPVAVSYIGGESFYVVDDDGFLRHIETEKVDREILTNFISQLQQNKDIAVTQALEFMGKDDLFTKAALDSSIDNVDINQLLQQGLPPQARDMMGMMGFRILINYHGEIVDFVQPSLPDEG